MATRMTTFEGAFASAGHLEAKFDDGLSSNDKWFSVGLIIAEYETLRLRPASTRDSAQGDGVPGDCAKFNSWVNYRNVADAEFFVTAGSLFVAKVRYYF